MIFSQFKTKVFHQGERNGKRISLTGFNLSTSKLFNHMNSNIDNFLELLSKNEQWPMLYYFKFIVQNNQEKLNQVKELFSDPSAITYKTSRDIRFIGMSCKQWMPDAESIIAIYEKASKVDGLIAL